MYCSRFSRWVEITHSVKSPSTKTCSPADLRCAFLMDALADEPWGIRYQVDTVMTWGPVSLIPERGIITLHVILADAFIQSNLQLIRLSRRHTAWSNVGLRALLKGPRAQGPVQILSWPHLGSNHRSCRSKSSNLTTMLQAATYSRLQSRIGNETIRKQASSFDMLKWNTATLCLPSVNG